MGQVLSSVLEKGNGLIRAAEKGLPPRAERLSR